MGIEFQIVIAILLDLIAGDPKWMPHPVRLIGNFAVWLETPARKFFPESPKQAGLATAIIVIGFTAAGTALVLFVAESIHPYIRDLASIYLLYSGLAIGDMIQHSANVYAALNEGNLQEARYRVGMICGRDVDSLDVSGVSRAAVESVAENLVDGVTAPLFYGILFGPVGMFVYKAMNTLDSTFGYKNERYLEFGWASAKIDDAANFIPARLTGLLVPVAAFFTGSRWMDSFQVFFRDRRNHTSPNAGHTEAAMAGALGVRLGGTSYYHGTISEKPTIGDPIDPIRPDHILTANRLFLVAALVFTGFIFLAMKVFSNG